jgi:soluble lytic murein transglycosylase
VNRSRPVLLAAMACAACSAQQPAPASHGLPTPLAASARPAPTAAGTVAGPQTPLRLEDFTPLLALPELQKAARALENGNVPGAAREVELALVKTPPAAADVPRWQMLLARLREQSNNLRGASASYDLAAQSNWALSGYALLGAGRMLVRQGRAADALERLKRVPLEQALAAEARLLTAEAAYQKGERDLAISTWREHLASPHADSDRANVSLRLAGALLDRAEAAATPAVAPPNLAKTAAPSAELDGEVVDALRLARRVSLEAADAPAVAERAAVLEKRALEQLPPAGRLKLAKPSPEEELVRIAALVSARRHEDAETAADALISQRGKRFDTTGCEAGVLRAKAIAGQRAWGKAADSLDDVLRSCKSDPELRARSLYLGGTYSASDGRHAQAVERYEKLEKELPTHTLADDARLRAALSHYELGAEARFTELLSTMQEDFPEGDLVLEGVFRLALRRIEKNDWAGAAAVLDRASALVGARDGLRGQELSGRERYFRARAWIETGEKERGTAELESMIRDVPLSYYMLHAYARLVELDPIRARRAREQALQRATQQPFSFEHRPEFDTPGFLRAMELLRVGDFPAAKTELDGLGLPKQGTAPAVLWGVALLYARAGSAKLSYAVARGLVSDWLQRWPSGDWVKAWEIAFPRPYRAIVEREAKKNALPQSLVYAVMREESAFDPDAVSHADAHGLMQLIVPTAKLVASPVGLPYDPQSLKRPAVNIALGCRALAKLGESFGGNPVLMVPGYNAGPGRPRRWLRERPHADVDVWVELMPITETRRYTKRVLASRAAYAFLYEPATADLAIALPVKLTQ